MFCSQCNRSQYVRIRGKNLLHCAEFSEPLDPTIENPTALDRQEVKELFPPSWTFATYCPFFRPERRQFKARKAYRKEMQNSQIPLSDEKKGLLAHIY